MTIYIISKYAESIIDADDLTRVEFYPHLVIASQYFDAAANAKDRELHDLDFLLSGTTAYFLSDDFGSAKVLCAKIAEKANTETSQATLLALYRYLLLNQKFPLSAKDSTCKKILCCINDYFETGALNPKFDDIITAYRMEIYNQDDPDEIYYVDILIAIIKEALEKTSRKLLPQYSNLESETWSSYFQNSNSMKLLWPSQQLIGEKGILLGNNAIVQLPTGVGKTKSIELIIRSAFLSNRVNSAVIIAPLRALCNEIVTDLTNVFESDVAINQFSDVLQDDFLFDFANMFKKHISVCTPEKFSYIMHHQTDVLSDIGLFIFDEAHMFDDGSRGAIYEFLVSEIRGLVSEEKQIVLLSAVLSNVEQINEWMFEGVGTVATSDKIKPTPKSIGFASGSKDIYYFTDDPNESDYFIPRSVDIIKLKLHQGERAQRYFPILSDSKDVALYYAIKLCHNGGVAIYVNRTDSVNTVIKRILDIVNREFNFVPVIQETDMTEAEKINRLISIYYGSAHEFSCVSKLGVFPHYADLPNGIRVAIEYALRHNKIRFIVCTTTLAQGVNIPIKYLFMTSFKASRNSMQIRKFQNLIGRTARSGMYTEGSIVVTDSKLYDNRADRKHGGNYRWAECINMFNPSLAEPCGSSILAIVQSFDVDFETTASGSKISKYIISNYSKSDCFSSLIDSLSGWYIKKKPKNINNNIFTEIMFRKSVTETIENHLCFVFASNVDSNYKEQAKNVCTQTLAYSLGTDDEKNLLQQLFSAIADKIISQTDDEQLQNLARTMVGIDLSQKISQWLIEKEIPAIIYPEEKLLEMIVVFFYETHIVKPALAEFDMICKEWIGGKTYFEICNNTNINCKMKEIETTCSKTISYDLSFFVGNIIDMLEIDSDDEDIVNPYFTFCELQKKLKYGVQTVTAISICENVFNDRYLSNLMTSILGDNQITAKEIIPALKNFKTGIYHCIEQFPTYFSSKLDFLL